MMRHDVNVGEGSSRLGIFFGVPSLSLFDKLLTTLGFEYLISFGFLTGLLSWEDSSFARTWRPSILYLFLLFSWVLCLINDWQVF